MTPASFKLGQHGVFDDHPGFTVACWQHRPISKGYVRAKSSDPYQKPAIQPNYLSDPNDIAVLLAGTKFTREIFAQSAISQHSVVETLPGPDVRTDDQLAQYFRDFGSTIYHPVGIPMLVQKADKPGFVIGVNGLVGNLGIAIGASLSVLLATRFGWQTAYVVPGAVCLVAAVLFVIYVPKEDEAPAKRKAKTLDLPPNVMARVFFIMTCAAVTGSIVFNFTTNGNGEMLKARIAELAANPWMLSVALLVIFSVASLMQLVVGALIDRYPLKNIYLPILVAQVPLFLLASQVNGWALLVVTTLFMVFVFGAIPFTDAMIVRYIDDRMRSRVTGMRLAIGFGVSSLVTAGIGPSVKEAGFPTLLMVLAGVAAITTLVISFLPSERGAAMAALKPAE